MKNVRKILIIAVLSAGFLFFANSALAQSSSCGGGQTCTASNPACPTDSSADGTGCSTPFGCSITSWGICSPTGGTATGGSGTGSTSGSGSCTPTIEYWDGTQCVSTGCDPATDIWNGLSCVPISAGSCRNGQTWDSQSRQCLCPAGEVYSVNLDQCTARSVTPSTGATTTSPGISTTQTTQTTTNVATSSAIGTSQCVSQTCQVVNPACPTQAYAVGCQTPFGCAGAGAYPACPGTTTVTQSTVTQVISVAQDTCCSANGGPSGGVADPGHTCNAGAACYVCPSGTQLNVVRNACESPSQSCISTSDPYVAGLSYYSSYTFDSTGCAAGFTQVSCAAGYTWDAYNRCVPDNTQGGQCTPTLCGQIFGWNNSGYYTCNAQNQCVLNYTVASQTSGSQTNAASGCLYACCGDSGCAAGQKCANPGTGFASCYTPAGQTAGGNTNSVNQNGSGLTGLGNNGNGGNGNGFGLCSPTLVISPPSQSVQTGATVQFTALFDPDGPSCLQAQSNVTGSASWSSANPAVASISAPGSVSGVSAGTATINAAWFGLVAAASADVTSATSPDFSLTASPASITVARGKSGSVIIGLSTRNGFNSAVSLSVSGLPAGVTLNENSRQLAGNWFEKLINFLFPVSEAALSRNSITPSQTSALSLAVSNATAFGAYTLTVRGASGGVTHSLPIPLTIVNCTGAGCAVTHSECFNNACVQTFGGGPNRCGSNNDCGPVNAFHATCDSTSQACVNTAGSGISSCANDSTCSGSTRSHLECQNNSCVIVGGAGASQCATVGSACLASAGSFDCTITATPARITLPGSSRLTWSCTGGSGATSCSIAGVTGGASGSASVSPQTNATYTLSCTSTGSGTVTKSVQVDVSSIKREEIIPR